MALSWNEIRKRAIEFSKKYADVTRENAEAQSFYNDFFDVFGISRRRIASFEEPVKKLGDKKGKIDLFWKGTLLAEQKSSGMDLNQAKKQAFDYFPGIKEEELPKYVMLSDFQTFELYDLEENTEIKFKLSELYKYVNHFGFIAGYTKRKFEDQEDVNITAGELIGDLHDKLVDNGYVGHNLEQFIIRLLFCLFADNTGIFEKHIFKFFIQERTKEDGSDLGNYLEQLFQVLNTPKDQRQKNLDEDLAAFDYINGDLFEGYLPITSFNSEMRRQLLKCCHFDWGKISPAIFGAMFQSATDQNKRRNLGAHYTSEQNIMKIIRPLFLDDLKERLESISRGKELSEFHNKIANLKFLDPACGCGNFLIIAYRELREIELQIIKKIFKSGQQVLDISELVKININQFYGIEIEELPAKIAEVAMWLVDHQMNMKLSNEFGLYFARIPLKSHANIIYANSLRMNWEDLVKKEELNFILGNPPFIGARYLNNEQKEDIKNIFGKLKGIGDLDYVTAWYWKAAQYIQNTKIKAAFVSTNSITQGVQVAVLWPSLLRNYGIKIHFAHRTFSWNNEARGRAAVYCIIIGFANFDTDRKVIFDYENPKDKVPQEIKVKNISPYLIDAPDVIALARSKPLSNIPILINGSIPADGGNLILTEDEKKEILLNTPELSVYIKEYMGAKDFLHSTKRYCLWLVGCSPEIISKSYLVRNRLNGVSKARESKPDAKTPSLFRKISQPTENYLAIPRTSSENRHYIPIGFVDHNIIASNDLQLVPQAKILHFALLTSEMHMTWVKLTAGRLESRYRYSAKQTYNTFPFPKNLNEKQIIDIEDKAKKILYIRAIYNNISLAKLYNPLTMPPELVKAHSDLDKAVDASYGKNNIKNERERIELLFNLYQESLSEH